MKVTTRLLSLLILGSFSVFGLRERPSNEIARKAVCTVRCEDGVTRDACNETCNSDQSDIPVTDFETSASFGFLCQTAAGLVLQMDPGVYIVEYRNQSSDWVNETQLIFYEQNKPQFVTRSSFTGWYQLRVTHADSDGISKSHITQWVRQRRRYEQPMKVPKIWLKCRRYQLQEVRDSPRLSVEIGFSPAEDASCVYVTSCSEDDTNSTKEQKTIIKKYPTFSALPSGKNFTVSIHALGESNIGDNNFLKFSTPSNWPFAVFKDVCVPDEAKDLNAIAASKGMNIYDITVTWQKPNYLPDYFIVNITSDVEESNGIGGTFRNVTWVRAKFRDVKISQEYNVSIQGWSQFGGGPETTKRFTIPPEIIDESGSKYTIIITAVLACVSLVMVTAVCVYLMRRRQKWIQSRIKSSKDEVDPNRLTITRVLGSGAFGVVKFGKLRDDKGVIDVAVKMLQDDTNKPELRNFRLEIEMMRSLGKHPNIVSFLGYRTSGRHPFLVIEYCRRGDLLSFLRGALVETNTTAVHEKEERYVSIPEPIGQETAVQENSGGSSVTTYEDVNGYIDTATANEVDATVTLTLLDMLNFGRQIAAGMEFLSSKKIVHRDLAARNVLVCDKHVVKISDFGLSRDIYRENMYTKTGNGRMPFKWMAIESLMRQVYTTQSDVWSFGIVLWEIFTLGITPYPEVPTIEILKRLQSGYRMERPEICSEALYDVVLSCWVAKPEDRPTFAALREQLARFISVAAKHEYLDVDGVSVEMPLREESTTSSSHDNSFPLQVGFVNDREPRIIHEGLERGGDDSEDCMQ